MYCIKVSGFTAVFFNLFSHIEPYPVSQMLKNTGLVLTLGRWIDENNFLVYIIIYIKTLKTLGTHSNVLGNPG